MSPGMAARFNSACKGSIRAQRVARRPAPFFLSALTP